jgi:hypothetical protein
MHGMDGCFQLTPVGRLLTMHMCAAGAVCFMCSCCHYGGADPVEAEEAVRDMCAAADMEPDGLTTKLLTLIDIGWQQLQCTA